jgi:hypothetical protein
MDPTVVLLTIRDITVDHDDRHDAALALDRWLRLGGFLPDGETHDAVTAEIGAVLGARVDVAVDAHLEADYEDRAGDDS